MDWISAHRKALLAAIGAVAVLFVDDNTAQQIIAFVDAALVLLVPNDQDAVARIYYR
jgi:hypothetical protein